MDYPSVDDLTDVSPGYCEEMDWPRDFAGMSPGYVDEHYEELLWTLANRLLDGTLLLNNAIGLLAD